MQSTSSSLSVVHALAPARVGGLESVVLALSAGQRDAGIRVKVVPVLTENPEGHPFCSALAERGIDCQPLQLGVREYRKEQRAIGDILRGSAADILHTHGYRSDVVDGSVAARVGVGRVTTVHGYTGGGLKNRTYEWIQRRAIRRFDGVIAVSEKLRSDLENAGVPESRLHKVVNAWEARDPLRERSVARAELGLDPTRPVIGWIGRMSREKGPDQMIRAAALAKTPGVILSMIGAGPQEEAARSLASGLGLSDDVRWHGLVPSAATYMAAFDVVVMSSRSEGTPVILLEAMSAGVPVVAMAVGGIPELAGAEATLVPAGDIEALARAIDTTLGDPLAARARADAARRRVRSEYSVGPWVGRHREIYEAIRGSRTRTR